ncbi:MAG: hypothetical protein ACU0GG_01975 [Paracoccaceae bacterium]
MKRSTLYSLAAVVFLGVGAGGYVLAQHMHGSGHGHGMHEHDEVTMPGLRGENASAQESEELALLFRKFETLSREVENLPNGIRTVTRSSDQEVMDALVSHAVGMIDRVHAKDDPKIIIQSPTLDTFFLHGDEIVSDVSVEDEGLVVIQTSDNPEVVAAMQIHAAEVTAMVDRGMAAVHDMMMEQGRGH